MFFDTFIILLCSSVSLNIYERVTASIINTYINAYMIDNDLIINLILVLLYIHIYFLS